MSQSLSLSLDTPDCNDVGENVWKAVEKLEGDGRNRQFEFRKGGFDRFDDMMEDTVEIYNLLQ